MKLKIKKTMREFIFDIATYQDLSRKWTRAEAKEILGNKLNLYTDRMINIMIDSSKGIK